MIHRAFDDSISRWLASSAPSPAMIELKFKLLAGQQLQVRRVAGMQNPTARHSQTNPPSQKREKCHLMAFHFRKLIDRRQGCVSGRPGRTQKSRQCQVTSHSARDDHQTDQLTSDDDGGRQFSQPSRQEQTEQDRNRLLTETYVVVAARKLCSKKRNQVVGKVWYIILPSHHQS